MVISTYVALYVRLFQHRNIPMCSIFCTYLQHYVCRLLVLIISPFLFCTPDGPTAVNDLDMPPAIARPSLLRSDIAAGLLHRELTPFAHSRRFLACRRPQLHCGLCVCVCVCVCVCGCKIRLINCLSTPLYLRSQLPSSSHPRLYPSYTPTPVSPLLYSDNRLSLFPLP